MRKWIVETEQRSLRDCHPSRKRAAAHPGSAPDGRGDRSPLARAARRRGRARGGHRRGRRRLPLGLAEHGAADRGARGARSPRTPARGTRSPWPTARPRCTSSALAAGLGPGDEVVVPSMTFVATVNAIAYTGATPVFADIVGLTEPWLDPARSRRRITPRTKAIMTMAYGGHPGETAALAALADERGLLLLEDAAHAAGSRVGGRHLGTFGRGRRVQLLLEQEPRGRRGRHGRHRRRRGRRAHAAAALARDDDADLGSPSRPRLRLRRRRRSASTTASTSRAARSAPPPPGAPRRRQRPRAAQLDARYRELLGGVDGRRARARRRSPGARLAHHLFTVVLDGGRRSRRVRARRSPTGASRRACTTRPPIASRSTRAARRTCPSRTPTRARAVTLPMFAHMTGGAGRARRRGARGSARMSAPADPGRRAVILAGGKGTRSGRSRRSCRSRSCRWATGRSSRSSSSSCASAGSRA